MSTLKNSNWVPKQEPPDNKTDDTKTDSVKYDMVNEAKKSEPKPNRVKTELLGIKLVQPQANGVSKESTKDNIVDNQKLVMAEEKQDNKLKEISAMEEESRRERRYTKNLHECSLMLQEIDGGRYTREGFRRLFQNKVSLA